jgi:hypothetical protein
VGVAPSLNPQNERARAAHRTLPAKQKSGPCGPLSRIENRSSLPGFFRLRCFGFALEIRFLPPTFFDFVVLLAHSCFTLNR